MLDLTKIQTIKDALPLIAYVRSELKRCSATGSIPENLDKNLVSEIITNNEDAKSKLPLDTTTHESIYKAIAAQIKISTTISGKKSLSKDELLKLMKEPVVSEAIQESGISADQVVTMLGDSFDMLVGLVSQINSKDPMAQMIIVPIVVKLQGIGITNEELNELGKNKKLPLSLLSKLPNAIKDPDLAELIKGQGINLSLLELLPLLLDSTTRASTPPESTPVQLESPEIKKESKKKEEAGWANGYGKWIVGGSSVVLAGIGFFVEDNIIKTALIALGALGVGGAVASNIESVQTMFGAPAKS